MNFLLLLSLAIAPGMAIMVYVFWKDRLNPEPVRLLFISFFLGVFSVLPAIFLELGFQKYFPVVSKYSILNVLFNALIGVALIEEGMKFLFLKRFIWKHPEFDEPFDGIMYAVMVSMGFATAENLLYVWQAEVSGMGLTTAVVRAMTAVPAHATFAILMGYFMGMARFRPGLSTPLQWAALWVAVLFHGMYDFFLFTQEWSGTIAGAVLSLMLGIHLSRKAIQIHTRTKGNTDPAYDKC